MISAFNKLYNQSTRSCTQTTGYVWSDIPSASAIYSNIWLSQTFWHYDAQPIPDFRTLLPKVFLETSKFPLPIRFSILCRRTRVKHFFPVKTDSYLNLPCKLQYNKITATQTPNAEWSSCILRVPNSCWAIVQICHLWCFSSPITFQQTQCTL